MKNNKGIAIVAVLTLVIIMVLLTTALVTVSKEHLFQTSKYYEKSVAENLAEAAVSEAVLILKSNSSWGEVPDDYLLMEAGNQAFSGASGKTPNSLISYDVKGLYYITFDSFSGLPYSYNNLDGASDPNGGWQGHTVPPGYADIIVNVAVGSVVKRVEVLITIPAGGSVPVMPTIGGKANFKFENGAGMAQGTLDMYCINPSGTPLPDPPNLHANSSGSDAIIINGDLSNVNIYNSGNLTAKGGIVDGGGNNLIDGATYDNDEREVPDIDITNLPTGVATAIDGGTIKYLPATNKISYNGADYGDGDIIADGMEIVYAGGAFNPKPSLIITKNIEVDGDLNLKGVSLEFDRPSDPPYIYLKDGGSLTLQGASNSGAGNLCGEGKIYALGGISVNTDGNGSIDTGAGSDISLYANENVFMSAYNTGGGGGSDLKYSGLIYTNGSFECINEGGDIIFNGSLLVKGDVKVNAKSGFGNAGSIVFGIDKNIIPPASPTGGDPEIKFWQDF